MLLVLCTSDFGLLMFSSLLLILVLLMILVFLGIPRFMVILDISNVAKTFVFN